MDAKDLIKKFEGFREKAYKCPADKWTMGYGFTYNPITFLQIEKGESISKVDADAWLDIFVSQIKKELYNLFPIQKLNTNQIEALVSFVFNIGITKFKMSRMCKRLNENEFELAAKEFDKWVFVKKVKLAGLVNRRKDEKNLFTQL